jgi:hypothetical protein
MTVEQLTEEILSLPAKRERCSPTVSWRVWILPRTVISVIFGPPRPGAAARRCEAGG